MPDDKSETGVESKIDKTQTSGQWSVIWDSLSRHLSVWLYVIGIGLTLIFGIWGFAVQPAGPEAGGPMLFVSYLYRSIQLFVLEFNCEPTISWQLALASWLGLMVSAGAVLQTVIFMFQRQMDKHRAGLCRGHVIVCGAGWRGDAFVRDLIRNNKTVVVIEHDAENDALSAYRRERHVHPIIGDAAQVATLCEAGIVRADAIILVCGSDAVNAEVLHAAHEAVGNRTGKPLICHCHVIHDDAFDILDNEIRSDTQMQIRWFNINRSVVFDLFTGALQPDQSGQPVRLDRNGIAPNSDTVVHLVIFGFSELAESLLVQSALLGHFPNAKPMKVTVFAHEASRIQRLIYERYPKLADLIELEIHEFCTDLTNGAYQQAVRLVGKDDQYQYTTIAVCGDDAHTVMAVALNITSYLDRNEHADIPILTEMSERAGWRRMLTAKNESVRGFRMLPFGSSEKYCTLKTLEHGGLEARARELHEAYVNSNASSGLPDSWDDLSHATRLSNIYAAALDMIRLRGLGMKVVPADQVKPNDQVVDEIPCDVNNNWPLAKSEHRRWYAEKVLAGWRLGSPRDNDKLINPLLTTALDDLTDEERQKTSIQITNIPKMIKKQGETVIKDPSFPHAPS